MRCRPIVVIGIALIAVVCGSTLSQAQTWPQRAVKFIVPLGPGSGVDIAARLFADRLAARWGKPVIVENRPGGDAFVAISAFVQAKDDHTLLFTPTSAFTAHPFQHERLPYDVRDLVPIARISNTLVAVAVPASSKVTTLDELVAAARARPGKLNWAGITGALDFAFAGFLRSINLDINKIPYRDGVQALNDLAEDRIEVYAAAFAIVRPQAEAGRVKIIALTNTERAPTMPDVPTAAEAGYPTLAFDGLVGLFGPQTMSRDVQDRIAADLQSTAADADLVGRLGATGQLVRPGNPDEFASAIQKQRSSIAAAAQLLGLKSAQ